MAEKSVIIQEIEPIHTQIIEEYLNNGHNKVQAVLKFKPDVAYNSCSNIFKTIIERPECGQYLQKRQTELKEAGEIKSLDILLKMKTWLNSDPSQFIGLTPQQVKELPPDIRQCIQAIHHKKRTIVNKQGKPETHEEIKVTLVDKVKTMDMLNKHIGFYSEDNKQKTGNVNVLIQNLALNNPDALYTLLKAMEETKAVE